jgi:hypothetical protein
MRSQNAALASGAQSSPTYDSGILSGFIVDLSGATVKT